MTLAEQLANIRRDEDIRVYEVTDALGVVVRVLSRWESGQTSPLVGNAAGWAEFLGRRLLVVHRSGRVLGDLLSVVERLPDVRRSAGFTQEGLGERMHVVPRVVSTIERKAGPRMWLCTAERYLRALDCEIVPVPVSAFARQDAA